MKIPTKRLSRYDLRGIATLLSFQESRYVQFKHDNDFSLYWFSNLGMLELQIDLKLCKMIPEVIRYKKEKQI